MDDLQKLRLEYFVNKNMTRAEFEKKYSELLAKREKADLGKYIKLVSDFLLKRINADHFANRYLALFTSETGYIEKHLFPIFEEFFESAEAFDPMMSTDMQTKYPISADTLYREVGDTYDKLKRILGEEGNDLVMDE